jgi:predicted nucleic acid-binding protein
MSASGSQSERPVICDTVVVNYFLAVGQFEFLAKMLGGAVQIPRAVFDPEEPEDISDEAASELRRGLRLHRLRTEDDSVAGEVRARSERARPHFERLPEFVDGGLLVALEMTYEELETFARLRDREYVKQFSLIAGLGRGEAAALAIADARGFDLATDDQDAIRVANGLAPEVGIHRIRALLLDAVEQRLLERSEAQSIHSAMRDAGFWDIETI